MTYNSLSRDQLVWVNVYRKDPMQEGWDVWVEICDGEFLGRKFKIYTDDLLQAKLSRGNQYIIKLKMVYRYHVEIYRTINRVKA